MAKEQISVLVVDDDDVAIEAVTRSLERQQVDLPIAVASDGSAALKMLRGEAGEPPVCSPLMILLDLNMSGMSGLEFLEALRADPKLHHNVVFVWTTSDSEHDRAAAYEKHVAGYLVKSSTDRRHGYLAHLLRLYQDHVSLHG